PLDGPRGLRGDGLVRGGAAGRVPARRRPREHEQGERRLVYPAGRGRLSPSTAPGLVSVLVPTFNHAAFLSECLESIAAQTYAPAELIVVDDASTDATSDVLSRFRGSATFQERFAGGIVIERNRS